MDQIDRLTAHFRAAGEAHHEAFAHVAGADPEWAAWYARHVLRRAGAVLGEATTTGELGRLLDRAEAQRQREAPDAEWPRYYAELVLRELGLD
jgi:hypothetical protein